MFRNVPASVGEKLGTRSSRRRRRLWLSLRLALGGWRKAEQGSVSMMTAVALPAALIACGAAVSYSLETAVYSDLQNAIDSAVLAGAAANGEEIATAERVFAAHLGNYARRHVENIQPRFVLKDGVLAGEIGGDFTNPFANILGVGRYPIVVDSAAARRDIRVCVLGLNEFDKGSFDVNGNPSFNASCAVQANSGSTLGMTQEGSAPVRAARFGVSGRQKTNAFSPAPTENSARLPDPFASLPFPPFDNCASSRKNGRLDPITIKSPTELRPGTYCGGLIVEGADVTMAPGVYVMVDGSFYVKGGGQVVGREVMIGFTGADSTLRLWGNSSLDVTSPMTGIYKNMQFFVDPNSVQAQKNWVSLGGSDGNPDGTPKLSYDGVAYFARQNFWVYGNAIVNGNSPTYSVIADKLWFGGRATVNFTQENRRGLDLPEAPSVASGQVRLLR